MTRDDFTKLINSTFESIRALNDSKGKEYSGDLDALENFKSAGKKLNVPPLTVLQIYAHKHKCAIDTMWNDLLSGVNRSCHFDIL